MKVLETKYDYQLEAGNQIAHFKNDLITSLWLVLPTPETREKYFEANREIGAVVDAFVRTVGAEYSVAFELASKIPEEKLHEEAVYVLANHLAKEIMKSDIAYIQKRNVMLGGNKFVVSIPFIKTLEVNHES